MLHHIRREYHSGNLDLADLAPHPYHQFDNWFQDVLKMELEDPNAMTLATCTAAGKPSARIVLLKDYSEAGFTFFTNYQSRKGEEILGNPHVALVFYWQQLHRQVRIEGRTEKLPAAESEAYFQSRPRGSQIGAWASPQSNAVASRQQIEEKVREVEESFGGVEKLPVPPFWGGYLVVPEALEFWQGQPSRLHDRFRYEKNGDEWKINRLAP